MKTGKVQNVVMSGVNFVMSQKDVLVTERQEAEVSEWVDEGHWKRH